MDNVVIGGIVSLLLGSNVYFIKRLVDKLDITSKAQEAASSEVAKLSRDVNGIGNQLREIKVDLKDLRRVEIEVAVLKSQYSNNPTNEVG